MQKGLNRLGKLGSCNTGCGVPHNFERPTCRCDKKLESITVVDEKIAVLFDDGSYLLADKDILSESLVRKTVLAGEPKVVADLEQRIEALETRPQIDLSDVLHKGDDALELRFTALEQRVDKDTVFDPSELEARLTALESKPDMDTVFDPSSLINRLNDLEAVDTSAFATKTELDNYVAKSDLVTVRNLENTQDLFKAISVGA